MRSNLLSYEPLLFSTTKINLWSSIQFLWTTFSVLQPMVEMKGIEPLTPCLQGRCSPSWATPPYLGIRFSNSPWKSNNNWMCESCLRRLFVSLWVTKDHISIFLVLHRKEVIQPHLPIRLPCYDLTPITEPTFGSCPRAVSSLTSGVSDFHGLTGGVYKARERIHRGMLIRDY